MNAELPTAEAPSTVKLPPMQEALLPGTKAIMKGTVEWNSYRHGYLVRYKSCGGSVQQRQFQDREQANAQFWRFCDEMAREVRAATWNGER